MAVTVLCTNIFKGAAKTNEIHSDVIAKLATFSGGYSSRLKDPSYWSKRGSEQLQIEYWNATGMSGNSIWGIGINNKVIPKFIELGLRLLFE